jgi:hypothetical protein
MLSGKELSVGVCFVYLDYPIIYGKVIRIEKEMIHIMWYDCKSSFENRYQITCCFNVKIIDEIEFNLSVLSG